MSLLSLSLGWKLAGIFYVFLQSIMIFGAAYSWLYIRNHQHFVFNSEIARRQLEVSRAEWERNLFRSRRLKALISDLIAGIVEREVTILPESAPGEVVLSSGYTYKFKVSSNGFSLPILYLEVSDDNNNVVDIHVDGSFFRGLPVSGPQFLEVSRRYVNELEAICNGLEKSLSAVAPEPSWIWGAWDFLYFSVVIQTTIGLGDILPNSTLIRKLVILQTLIGYGILIVLLNLVIGNNH